MHAKPNEAEHRYADDAFATLALISLAAGILAASLVPPSAEGAREGVGLMVGAVVMVGGAVGKRR